MPRRGHGKGNGKDLAPGEVEVRTRRVDRVREHGDLDLEAWFAQLEADSTIARVVVLKKNATGRFGKISGGAIDRPFTEVDPEEIFRQYGDGEYQFCPVKVGGGYMGRRIEAVQGYGDDRGGGTGTAGRLSGGLGQLRRLNDIMEEQIISETLDRRLRRLQGEGAAGDEAALSHEERRVLSQEAMDRDLERLIKLRALIPQPKEELTLVSMIEKVIPLFRELFRPPDPIEKQLAVVDRVLELKDKLGGPFEGELPDWKSLGMLALAAILGANPQFKDVISRLLAQVVPPAPARPLPSPTPISPPSPGGPPGSGGGVTVVPPGGAPVPGQDPRTQAALLHVLGLLRQAIEMNSRDPELYAELVDVHLPHFLDEWAGLDHDQALAVLAAYDPFFATEPAIGWLKAWWKFLKEDYLVESEHPEPPAPPPPPAAPTS